MAAGRENDLAFAPSEKLWRRVEAGDVIKGDPAKNQPPAVKPNRLRLQISMVREKHGSRESVTSGKWNGIAETTAAEAAAITEGMVCVACVDEPTTDQPGHALIALYVKPGDAVDQTMINAARSTIAGAMRVVVMPTKA